MSENIEPRISLFSFGVFTCVLRMTGSLLRSGRHAMFEDDISTNKNILRSEYPIIIMLYLIKLLGHQVNELPCDFDAQDC